ncbi:MAG: hypothetical protein A3B23_03510 [Candidatus Colwellbacteria bacterium RIFCSPLOWO2_01_FULL_48_10]|nr:MAG: hypothetical protein A3B23_03510 [Candidatus Colwellbacteria bacterium RIFCSPLOWO2_01_FULL_48_10]
MPEWRKVLRAIENGARGVKEIASLARVPGRNMGTHLSTLRKRGFIKGYKDEMRVTANGRRELREGHGRYKKSR